MFWKNSLLVCTFGILFSSCMISKNSEDIPFEDLGGNLLDTTEESSSLSDHFSSWLEAHPRFDEGLIRADIVGGSFGGKEDDSEEIHHIPIVFVHGNSDRAYGGPLGGWKVLYHKFLDFGYSSAELYATTYGPADSNYSSQYTHNKENLMQIRLLLEAVLEYTGASKVHIISHSLGVTIARKVVLGGVAIDDDGSEFNLGPPLTNFVEVFVGIAGVNQGLAQCYGSTTPVCSHNNGLDPGYWSGWGVTEQSKLIQNINNSAHYEGSLVYSLWSSQDLVVGFQCIVWGANTCLIPHADASTEFPDLDHFSLRDETFDTILSWLIPLE